MESEIGELPSLHDLQQSSNVSMIKREKNIEIARIAADEDEIVKEEPKFYENEFHSANEEHLWNKEYENNGETGKSFDNGKGTVRRECCQRLKSPVQKTYECYLCKKAPSTSNNLRRHLVRYHLTEGAFQCKICSKRFFFNCDLKMHRKTHKTNIRSKSALDESSYQCEYCMRSFNQRKNLFRHRGTCLPLLLNPRESQLFAETGHFECYLCKWETIGTFGTMKIHFSSHSGEQIFNCNICQRKFHLQTKLVAHVRTHTSDKQFKCETCSKEFTKKRNLKRHRRIHTTVGLFECSFCSKKLTAKFALQMHERIHTGEKPYICSNCGQGFTRKDTMNRHQRKNHPV